MKFQSGVRSFERTSAPDAADWQTRGLPPQIALLARRRRLRRSARALTVVGDLLAIVIAYLIGGIIRFGDPFHGQVLNILSVMLPVFAVVAINQRSYAVDALVNARRGGAKALTAFLVTLSVVGLVVFFLKVSTDFSRAVFGTGAVIAMIALPLTRTWITVSAHRMLGGKVANEVVIEDDVDGPSCPGAVVLNARYFDLSPRLNDPAMLDRLGRYLECADRVIVACPPDRRQAWATALKGADVNAEVFAAELDEVGALGMSKFENRSTLIVAAGPLGLVDRTLKRSLDLALVALSLPVTLPLMAVVAVLVKLDSRGPVFFVQQRVGLGNRLFRVFKFRSMTICGSDDVGHRSTGRGDDRITRVGRFIRATSLDELPQLLNVVSGAMSIVGPRPHALGSRANDQLFWDIDMAYWHRHAVKPGMTGLAQVRGYRGATEHTLDLQNRLQADLEYLSGWSIWRDLAIIFATFRILIHRNAY